jgi:hypothetical protein
MQTTSATMSRCTSVFRGMLLVRRAVTALLRAISTITIIAILGLKNASVAADLFNNLIKMQLHQNLMPC